MYFEYKENKKMYYEVYGEGKPLLILNGLMMATKSWHPFVEELSRFNKLILVDYLDQGYSTPITEQYEQSLHVESIKEFINYLDLEKTSIYGVSYGGEIGLQLAIKYPEIVDKLLLFNTSANTTYSLKLMGEKWINATNDSEQYYLSTIPGMYSPKFFNNNVEWIESHKEELLQIFGHEMFISSIKRMIKSTFNYDVRNQLDKVKAPTFIVASEYDVVTPYDCQKLMHKKIENSYLVYIPDAGHAVMFEQPNLIISMILGFLLTEHKKYEL